MEVLIFPDSRLRQVSKPVTEFDDDLKKLVSKMMETMRNYKGIGLAAPQVGVHINLILNQLDFEEKDKTKRKDPVVMVNPKILEKTDKVVLEEGCLSTPNQYADVERDKWIKVEFQDVEGEIHQMELDGYQARMVLHEMDHLIGKVFLDHLGVAQRNFLIKKLKKSLRN